MEGRRSGGFRSSWGARGGVPTSHRIAACNAEKTLHAVGAQNKRKRAPRGPAGRNVKAKTDGDDGKVDSALEEVSVSNSGGFRELLKDEERSGTENEEAGVNSKEQAERRRGSSRLRIRPSKFREGAVMSSSKVKGEVKSSGEERIDLGNKGSKPRDDPVQLVPSQVDTRELIARIFSTRKETKSKSTPGRDGEQFVSTPVVHKSPDRNGLKAVLSASKRVMKMKEAEPFNKPVDPIKLGIPDYLEVVKRPMDLGTIRDRLEKGEVYNTVDDVFVDVALVWSNCRQYNDDGDPIMGFLENLESTFNKLCLAADSPSCATNIAEANVEKSTGEVLGQQTADDKVRKKKKVKDAQCDAVALLKTKIKRSAPVDQVMAESKAREQKGTVGGVYLEDRDRDFQIAGASSSGTDKQVEISPAELGSEVVEGRGNDHETVHGPVTTPPSKEGGSTPVRHLRKSTSSQPANLPAKAKRPNGRKREAKLRKSGAHLKANKSAKKNPGGSNSVDSAIEAEEDVNFAEDSDDALYGYPEILQGCASANFQLPLRKLDPGVVEMSRILLGSQPGSIWNRPRSLGYVSVPPPASRIGLADAISSLSKAY